MLEIVIIYFMCKGIGDILRKKNRHPLWLQILAVILWIGGEITGFIASIAMMVLSGRQPGDFDIVTYLFCLVGAASGAGISFLIAFLIPAAEPPQPLYGYGPGQNFAGPKGDPTNPYAAPQAPQNPFADRR